MDDETERTLIDAIGRRLERDGRHLCLLRGEHYTGYYVVEGGRVVGAVHGDLASLARALGLGPGREASGG